MHSRIESQPSIFGGRWTSTSAALAILVMLLFLLFVFLFMMFTAQPVQAQTYKVIYSFTGGADGEFPAAGLTMDSAGNLYGTTSGGYSPGVYGTVFKLTQTGSGWVLTTLYSFAGGDDGQTPLDRVALAQNGSLYGTTDGGGEGCDGIGCGTVFKLRPSPAAPKSVQGPWNETVLYRFTGGEDGGVPRGELIFDGSGNIYGTAVNPGVIYELSPSGGGWTETVLYSGFDSPEGGVIFDKQGNLYGVFGAAGQFWNGAIYQLSPSSSGWTEHTLYILTGGGDGSDPIGGLIIDSSGDLYGTTALGGAGDAGTVFELTHADGNWTFKTLYSFPGPQNWGPVAKLVMDAAGNLYGTVRNSGPGKNGSVFKLTFSNGGWTYTSLYDFTYGSDGAFPECSLIFDTNGNLYGTALAGGAYSYGVVFEITP